MFGSSRKKNEEGFGSREHDVTQTSSLISTRPKPPSCFQPDPNLPPVFNRPKPLSCFRPESNLLPSCFLPDPNLPETEQQERKTNQQTHQPKRKIYNPNLVLQTTANSEARRE